MKRITLKNFTYNNQRFDTLEAIIDDNGRVILLPLLFATYLATVGNTIQFVQIDRNGQYLREMREKPVAPHTARSYMAHLFKFLCYINQLAKDHPEMSVHQTNRGDSQFVNDYINNVLVYQFKIASLDEHCSALTAFYNFLAFMNISAPLELKVIRKARQAAAEISEKPHVIRYVSKQKRSDLLLACNSKCERLILRMGFEVGLRSSENCGLLIKKGNNERGYLLELFKKLDLPESANQGEFEYVLHGKYTKGGRTRRIYFKRELLVAMRDYYLTERAAITAKAGIDPNELFLRVAPNSQIYGTAITARHASNIFSNRQKSVAGLDPNLGYHSLRHTFGTELFYLEQKSKDGRETRSQSAALLVVACRLGHKIGRDGLAPATTTRYIRMCEQMLEIERDNANEPY